MDKPTLMVFNKIDAYEAEPWDDTVECSDPEALYVASDYVYVGSYTSGKASILS